MAECWFCKRVFFEVCVGVLVCVGVYISCTGLLCNMVYCRDDEILLDKAKIVQGKVHRFYQSFHRFTPTASKWKLIHFDCPISRNLSKEFINGKWINGGA